MGSRGIRDADGCGIIAEARENIMESPVRSQRSSEPCDGDVVESVWGEGSTSRRRGTRKADVPSECSMGEERRNRKPLRSVPRKRRVREVSA